MSATRECDMPFFAHSAPPSESGAPWHLLADHLRGVADRAKAFAQAALPDDREFVQLAWIAGLLHDLGKYRPEFQEYLAGRRCKSEATWHKQAGAAWAADSGRADVAFAIAGHHGGIPNKIDLVEGIKKPGGRDVCQQVLERAIRDCSALQFDWPPAKGSDPRQFDLRVRMLFSCLVDADWQDTSHYCDTAASRDSEPPPPLEAARMLEAVLAYLQERAQRCEARMRRLRDEVLQASLSAAQQSTGLFAMTVPTGGGKTLASLAFALAHAQAHGLRRIIYVAPYLSILEQNAREIRCAIGVPEGTPTVFEHHSLSEPGDSTRDDPDDDVGHDRQAELRRRAENWDAPLIVTTNVQFLESLFSNRPGRCRKLHNIARSVVILDECQTLSPGLVSPTCLMLQGLVEEAGASIVLCTATQPAWTARSDFPDGLKHVREIAPPELDLFRRLVRVRVEWPSQDDPPWDWSRVAREMAREPSSLCIVNTRRSALELFGLLREQGLATALHLATFMCPAHRLAVVDEVRRRLAAGESCHLVSTQLIEAGVDVDFPLVLRELGPLESIIQAAGRCNREGLLNSADNQPGGRVVVFRAQYGSLLDDWYKRGAQILESNFLRAGSPPDIGCPEHVADYFVRLYRSGELDKYSLQSARLRSLFATIEEKYKLITEVSRPVVVATWERRATEIEALLEALDRRPTRANFRRLTPFQVNLPAWKRAEVEHLIVPRGEVDVWLGLYDEATGLSGGQMLEYVF